MSGLGAGKSDVDIVSQALVLIGEAPISSLTEGTAGVVASSLYETTKDTLLQKHRWRFATAKASLSRLTATPLNEWTYGFQLPTNLRLILRVYPHTPYEMYEDKIYSNSNTLQIDYLIDPGEGDYPAYFVKALTYRLASEMALGIANNQSLSDAWYDKSIVAISEAMHMDSQGRPNQAIHHRPLINVRG